MCIQTKKNCCFRLLRSGSIFYNWSLGFDDHVMDLAFAKLSLNMPWASSGLRQRKGGHNDKTSNIELLYSYSLLIVNRHGIYFHLRIFEICSQGKYCDHENVLHTFLGPLSPNNQVLQIGLYLCIWSVKLRNLYKTETNVFVKIN